MKLAFVSTIGIAAAAIALTAIGGVTWAQDEPLERSPVIETYNEGPDTHTVWPQSRKDTFHTDSLIKAEGEAGMHSYKGVPADELRKMSIVDPDGMMAGRVKSVLLDTNNHVVAIVATGTGGANDAIIPLDVLDIDQQKRELMVQTKSERLRDFLGTG